MDGRSLTSAENGRLGGRPVLRATKLREAIIRLAEQEAEPLAQVLMDKAKTGDVPAIKEMFDRALGKALQNIDMTTDGESLNETIAKLDDSQLDKLIASVTRTLGGTPAGEKAEDSGEPA